MTATRSQKARLGLFIIVGMTILLGSIAMLAGLKFWNPRDRYTVHFRESVAGLEPGSAVKVRGVQVGRVESIRIEDDEETVRVTLGLQPGTPITVDTRAMVASFGITGLKFIELTGGSKRSSRLLPNASTSDIPSKPSTFDTLTGKAEDIARKIEDLVNKLRMAIDDPERIQALINNTSNLAHNWAELADVNKGRIQNILKNVETISNDLTRTSGRIDRMVVENSQNLTEAISSVSRASNAIAKTAQSFRPDIALTDISQAAQAVRTRANDPNLVRALANMAQLSSQFNDVGTEVTQVIRARDRQLAAILTKLDRSAANIQTFSRAIRDQPSLLLRGETGKDRTDEN